MYLSGTSLLGTSLKQEWLFWPFVWMNGFWNCVSNLCDSGLYRFSGCALDREGVWVCVLVFAYAVGGGQGSGFFSLMKYMRCHMVEQPENTRCARIRFWCVVTMETLAPSAMQGLYSHPHPKELTCLIGAGALTYKRSKPWRQAFSDFWFLFPWFFLEFSPFLFMAPAWATALAK